VGRGLCFAWLAAALLWASEAAALDSGGFTLETGSPDALCPELEATRAIVARRLGSLVDEGRKGWLARYTIGHAPAGSPRDFVRLELFNPEGGVELRRDLPMEGDSCRTMSEVIALVLDRHFRGLTATDQSSPASAKAARPHSPASAFEHPRAPREPASASHLPLTSRGPRLSAEYAASLAQAYLGLRVSAGLGPRLEAALGLRWGVTSLEESEPRGASVEARTATSRASLAWRVALPPGLLHFGPALSLAIQRARTRGLQSPTDRTRALWTAGVEAGFVTPVGHRLFIEGSTSLDFLLRGAGGQFLVDNREVLSPRTLTLGWALGFGYVF
jgi:hypothetical protein